MKLLFKSGILILGLFFTAAVFAQENKPVPLKTIPVKDKKGDSILYIRKRFDSKQSKWRQAKDISDVLKNSLISNLIKNPTL